MNLSSKRKVNPIDRIDLFFISMLSIPAQILKIMHQPSVGLEGERMGCHSNKADHEPPLNARGLFSKSSLLYRLIYSCRVLLSVYCLNPSLYIPGIPIEECCLSVTYLSPTH